MAEGHGAAGDKDGRGRRRHKRCLAEGADWQDAFKHLLRAATLSNVERGKRVLSVIGSSIESKERKLSACIAH